MTKAACICPTCGQPVNKEAPHVSWQECMRFICSRIDELDKTSQTLNETIESNNKTIGFQERRIQDLEVQTFGQRSAMNS